MIVINRVYGKLVAMVNAIHQWLLGEEKKVQATMGDVIARVNALEGEKRQELLNIITDLLKSKNK